MVSAAQRYVFLVRRPVNDALVTLRELRSSLAELHAAIVRFSDIESVDEAALDEVVTQEEREAVREKFANLPVNGYWEMSDPLDPSVTEPVFGVLEDDLADIYAGLAPGLSAVEAGDARSAAAHWRWTFKHRWGRRLLAAERVVYEYFRSLEI